MIIDPFMGTGTTLRACKELGKQAIGIDISEKYCEIAANLCMQEIVPLVPDVPVNIIDVGEPEQERFL